MSNSSAINMCLSSLQFLLQTQELLCNPQQSKWLKENIKQKTYCCRISLIVLHVGL